jgi:hypothetical protein
VIAEIIGAVASNSLFLIGDAAAMSVDVVSYACSTWGERVKDRTGAIDAGTRMWINIYIPLASVVALLAVSKSVSIDVSIDVIVIAIIIIIIVIVITAASPYMLLMLLALPPLPVIAVAVPLAPCRHPPPLGMTERWCSRLELTYALLDP